MVVIGAWAEIGTGTLDWEQRIIILCYVCERIIIHKYTSHVYAMYMYIHVRKSYEVHVHVHVHCTLVRALVM